MLNTHRANLYCFIVLICCNPGKKRLWSNDEKQAVLRHLNQFLIEPQLPGKEAIEQCKENEQILERRSWRNIKDFCRNQILSKIGQ